VRLVAFDVDGVLTDGGIYVGLVGSQEVELKRFHSLDGMAFWLLRKAGLLTCLVSGRSAQATVLRGRELGVDEVLQDVTGGGSKLAPFEAALQRRGIRIDECAYVGDDLTDLPLMRRVCLPVAVANALEEVRAAATYVTRAAGGHGAVREFADALLKARGVYADVVRQYLRERTSDVAVR
jgi:3-deoxy-D-manno-octulosonate 8-phosphate phosphatase (KDO 8-P phosphatase)